jgi:hypothetical protein
LWIFFTNFIETNEEIPRKILSLINKTTKNQSSLLKFTIYGQLFHILSVFSHLNNTFAPAIYKTLAFCLVENYSNENLREFMQSNMQKIFEEFSSIPLGVLLEPYIKQCQISKNVALNVFDFEFF